MNKKDRKELAEYQKAKACKRVFTVPNHLAYAGAGDFAYLLYGGEVVEVLRLGLHIAEDGELFIGLASEDPIFECLIDVTPSDIGKTLFFSREEAERKLAEMEESE